jgi:hypothetical protein
MPLYHGIKLSPDDTHVPKLIRSPACSHAGAELQGAN